MNTHTQTNNKIKSVIHKNPWLHAFKLLEWPQKKNQVSWKKLTFLYFVKAMQPCCESVYLVERWELDFKKNRSSKQKCEYIVYFLETIPILKHFFMMNSTFEIMPPPRV